MTIQQRQALWIQTHATDAWSARKADLWLRHPSKTNNRALELLFIKVTEGRA